MPDLLQQPILNMSDILSVSTSQENTPDVRFADFGLAPEILRALTEQGYVHPTPIQAEAIPVVLQGRDVMGAAQTGTGKTAGFSLPIIQRLLPFASTSVSPARHPVRALILTPTRELADQVADNVRAYSRFTPLRSTVVFGGVDMASQTTALRAGVEIIIATPGRLLDHIQQKTVNLSQTEILVMDEADRMLDMGFLPDLQRIINLLPKQRQNLMFSATFSPEIKKLAGTFQNNPVMIEVARSNATAENVTQTIYQVEEADKYDAVSFLVRERGLKQVIVFCNTKLGASRLTRHLEKEGVKASAIHGDKMQSERIAALDAFKQGGVEVLVATDVAARGLDIAELPCVINVDLPYNAEDYVHRIGRTGRAGASGDAISLFSAKDERLLVDIEKLIKRKFERAVLTGFVPGGSRRQEPASRPDNARGNRRQESGGRQDTPRSSSPLPRKQQVDAWFLKPYAPEGQEAAEASVGNDMHTSQSVLAGNQGTRQQAKPKVAALLGGQRK